MSESIGFVGLGNMGRAIASSLLKAGYRLRVYNRDARKAETLVAAAEEIKGRYLTNTANPNRRYDTHDQLGRQWRNGQRGGCIRADAT